MKLKNLRKLNFLLVCICPFFGFQSFSQDVTNYGPFPKITDNQFNFSYLTKDYILLDKYDVLGNRPTHTRKNHWYYSIDLRTTSKIISKQVKIYSGENSGRVFKSFFTDSYIIEFIDFAAGATSNVGIGALKRDPITLDILGEVKIIDSKIQYSVNDPNINIQKTSNGYIYTRIINNQYIVSYLDEDFNEGKKTVLEDEVYKDQSIKLLSAFIKSTDNDELLIVKLTNFSKDWNSFDFHFTAVKPNGEVIDVNTDYKKSSYLRNFEINYLSQNNLFEGIIYWSIPPVMKGSKIDQSGKNGYQYFIWDENGNELVEYSREFTVEEIYADYQSQLANKYSEKELRDKMLLNYSPSVMLFSDEGTYLILNQTTLISELMKSTFIVKIDKSGKTEWSKTLFSNTYNSLANFSLTANNDLRILLEDFNSTNSNGHHEADILKKGSSKELTSVFDVVLNKENGEFLKNQFVDLNLPEGSKINRINLSEDKSEYLIESINGKNLYFSVIKF